jgi:hypothetical protein
MQQSSKEKKGAPQAALMLRLIEGAKIIIITQRHQAAKKVAPYAALLPGVFA